MERSPRAPPHLSDKRRARLCELKCCEDAKGLLEEKLKSRFGRHAPGRDWDEQSVASSAIRRDVDHFAMAAPLTEANLERLERRVRHRALAPYGGQSLVSSAVYSDGCSCASRTTQPCTCRHHSLYSSCASGGRARSAGPQAGQRRRELASIEESSAEALTTQLVKIIEDSLRGPRGGFKGQNSRGREAVPPARSREFASICGKNWTGPAPPARAENKSLTKGTTTLPQGPMRTQGTTYGDLGTNNSGQGFLKRAFNRTLARGTVALPPGRMQINGTTHRELGNMYTYHGGD